LSCTVHYKPPPGTPTGGKKGLGDQTCHLVKQMAIAHIVIALVDPLVDCQKNQNGHQWFQTNFDYILEYVPPPRNEAEAPTSRVELDSHAESSGAAASASRVGLDSREEGPTRTRGPVLLIANKTWKAMEDFMNKIDDIPSIWTKTVCRIFLADIKSFLGTEEEQKDYDNALIYGLNATHFRHLPIIWRQVRERKTIRDNKPLRVPIWWQTHKIIHAEEPQNGIVPATFLGSHQVKSLDFPRAVGENVEGDDDIFSPTHGGDKDSGDYGSAEVKRCRCGLLFG